MGATLKNTKANVRVVELTSLLETCNVMEITAMNWAPYYNKGDMLFIHRDGKLKQRDHVALTTRSGRQVLGIYVEKMRKQMVIQSLDKVGGTESFDDSDLTSISKIIATIHP